MARICIIKLNCLLFAQNYGKEVSVRFDHQIPSNFSMEGVEIVKVGKYGAKLRFDTRVTPVDRVMSRLGEKGNLVDITVSDPSLEEVIAKIYQEVQYETETPVA